jgi:hypothetical protein
MMQKHSYRMLSGQKINHPVFLGNPGKNSIIFLCKIGQNQGKKSSLFWANLNKIKYENVFLSEKLTFLG